MKNLWKGIAILGIWGAVVGVGITTTRPEAPVIAAFLALIATICIAQTSG